MSSHYKDLYFRNCYEVERSSSTAFYFSLEHFIDSAFFDRSFSIITAFNPQNKILSLEENQQRDRLLYSTFHIKEYELLRATGSLDDHSEAGWLIYDISLDDVLTIALMYDQYAIFYNDTKSLQYIECKTKKVIAERKRDVTELKL